MPFKKTVDTLSKILYDFNQKGGGIMTKYAVHIIGGGMGWLAASLVIQFQPFFENIKDRWWDIILGIIVIILGGILLLLSHRK